jgi:hypothetical protein
LHRSTGTDRKETPLKVMEEMLKYTKIEYNRIEEK